MNFDETMMKRLTRLEREVERLRVWERPAGGSGVTDHGALTGLADNDHPQYLLTTGKAADSDKLDGIDSTGFATAGHDHNAAYLGITAKAADSDKLDNLDSTAFALAGHDHNAAYLGISAKAADSDKLDGLDSTEFLQTPSWTSWTPTQTGWTALPTGTYRYFQVGKMCFFAIDITAGTSNSTAATLTLPFTVKSGVWYGGVNGMCMDNGTVLSVATKWYIDTPLSRIQFGTDMGTGVFTASGTKRIRCEGFYEIA